MMIIVIQEQIITETEPNDNLLCHFYYGRPIQKVQISGVIVSLEITSKRCTVIVDDGTACIRCIKYLSGFQSQLSSLTDLAFNVNVLDTAAVGDYVIVKGLLEKLETNSSNYEFMVKISIVEKQENPNTEIYETLSTLSLTVLEYRKPLSPFVEQKS
jgi:aspartyl/asparaginyl-tRNA synthetase